MHSTSHSLMKSALLFWTVPVLVLTIFNLSPRVAMADPPGDQSALETIPPMPGNPFNNTRLSALTYPNCNGTCLFAIGRLVPSNNGNTSVEAVAGVVWQLRSPDNTHAETQRLIINNRNDLAQQESIVVLLEKLAEAREQGKQDRSTLLAILLAKRLGYVDHKELLQQLNR